MNTNWHDLIQRYLSGTITDDEARSLEQQLTADPDLRDWYLDALNLDSALEATAESAQTALSLPVPLSYRAQSSARHGSARWLSWRPLTAAAAGIVFGMLCTSVVFGFVGQRGVEKKTPLALVQPGFEDAQMLLAKGFPDDSARWGGDEARVVTAENGVQPKDGHHMLRLETTASGAPVLYPRLYQVIALPPSTAELRDIEVSASFVTADPGSSPYYSIRVYAVTQVPELLGPDWFDDRNDVIAMAARGMDNPPDSTGWQSFGLRVQVPDKARSLVVFFGVKNKETSPAKRPHYLDDVQVSFIDSPPIP
jgi:hypothetical protein